MDFIYFFNYISQIFIAIIKYPILSNFVREKVHLTLMIKQIVEMSSGFDKGSMADVKWWSKSAGRTKG